MLAQAGSIVEALRARELVDYAGVARVKLEVLERLYRFFRERHLDGAGIKVVTNHVGMALEAGDRALELILVGGHYRQPSNSLVGPFATEALRRVHATKAFLGVEGVSVRSGATTPSAVEAEIARLMIERTRGQVILVADSSKMGTVADFVVAGLDQVTGLVTDPGIDVEYLEGLAEAGVDVMVAEEPTAATRGTRA
jgi:DeoR/GlpR family transcriptional regulator of sugar metabolism